MPDDLQDTYIGALAGKVAGRGKDGEEICSDNVFEWFINLGILVENDIKNGMYLVFSKIRAQGIPNLFFQFILNLNLYYKSRK